MVYGYLDASSIKTGRRKLGLIYAQLVQRRLGRFPVFFFFYRKLCLVHMLLSTFMRPVPTPKDLEASNVKYVYTLLTSRA